MAIENEEKFIQCLPYEDIEVIEFANGMIAELTMLRLLLFQPFGDSHHDANKCPYCQENLNGK